MAQLRPSAAACVASLTPASAKALVESTVPQVGIWIQPRTMLQPRMTTKTQQLAAVRGKLVPISTVRIGPGT